MANPYSFAAVAWATGDTITETKLDQMMENANWLKHELQNEHDHDGVNSPEIAAATETIRGGVHHLSDTTGQISSTSSSILYLTENRLSGGTEIFWDAYPALAFVWRHVTSGSTSTGPSGNKWTCEGLGYTTTGTGHYYWTYDPGTAGHPLEVFNRDASSAWDYLVIAVGPGGS